VTGRPLAGVRSARADTHGLADPEMMPFECPKRVAVAFEHLVAAVRCPELRLRRPHSTGSCDHQHAQGAYHRCDCERAEQTVGVHVLDYALLLPIGPDERPTLARKPCEAAWNSKFRRRER
jgi:hypothetical protein